MCRRVWAVLLHTRSQTWSESTVVIAIKYKRQVVFNWLFYVSSRKTKWQVKSKLHPEDSPFLVLLVFMWRGCVEVEDVLCRLFSHVMGNEHGRFWIWITVPHSLVGSLHHGLISSESHSSPHHSFFPSTWAPICSHHLLAKRALFTCSSGVQHHVWTNHLSMVQHVFLEEWWRRTVLLGFALSEMSQWAWATFSFLFFLEIKPSGLLPLWT